MEGAGEIQVTGRLADGFVILSVTDNGMGMTGEAASLILTDSSRKPQHGSGVGLINVDSRIRILFGKEYGLTVLSEPDEGTEVSIRIPAVLYTEENRKVLEQGYLPGKEEAAYEG